MKSKVMSAMLAFLSLFILLGVVLSVFMLLNLDNLNIIHIKLDGENSQAVEFKNFAMVPGEETEYTLALFSEIEGECTVSLSFSELTSESDNAELKKYVRATIETESGVDCDMLLSELMRIEKISFKCSLDRTEPFNVTVRYYMPDDVGNEAQGEETSFELIITASNEE